jgi:hypothetical protein
MARFRDGKEVPSADEQLRIDLKRALGDIKSIGTFAAFGSLYSSDLIEIGPDVELDIKGIGRIELPLTSTDSEALINLSRESHENAGFTDSLHLYFRRSEDVDPSLVSFGRVWQDLLIQAVEKTKVAMGLAMDTPYVFRTFSCMRHNLRD